MVVLTVIDWTGSVSMRVISYRSFCPQSNVPSLPHIKGHEFPGYWNWLWYPGLPPVLKSIAFPFAFHISLFFHSIFFPQVHVRLMKMIHSLDRMSPMSLSRVENVTRFKTSFAPERGKQQERVNGIRNE